jgi:hypothetical protein
MAGNPDRQKINDWLRKIKNTPHLLGRLLGYKKLISLHNKWIIDCWDTAGSHGLMAFRGSYKTTAIVIVGIIRYLLFHPSARILVVRKTHAEACKIIKAVSKAFDKPEIQALFTLIHGIAPQKITDKIDELLFNFSQNPAVEPSLTAKGIKDAITGAHFDVIIADDIIGLQDKTSRAERESVKESIRELAGNIIDPGALVIWLGTKWAKGDGWDVIETFTAVQKYPESKYNTFIPKAELEEKWKRLTPFLKAINYELELISDEGLLFQDPRYGHFDVETWQTGRVVAHIDAAYDGDNSCALTIMSGNHAIGWIFEDHVQKWYDFIVRKIKEWHCSKLYLEKNADKGFLARDLRKEGLPCEDYSECMNKEIKISTYLYKSWADIIWDEQTDPRYMNQILDWKPDGKVNDDAPDSAASLLREAFNNSNKKGVSVKQIPFGGL